MKNKNLNIFLIWAGQYKEISFIFEELKKVGDISYWVGLKGEGDKISGTIFHDHFEAWAGGRAKDLEDEVIDPPSKELIEKMYKTESLVLTMMHKKFDDWTVDKRKHLYYRMLGYWNFVFDKYKPNVVIFPTTPHTVYNYVIYCLAKEKGIPTLMLEDTWVGDRMLLYRDWMDGSEKFKNSIKENLTREIKKSDLSPEMQEYFETQTETKRMDATPIYMTHWKKQNSPWNLFLKKLKIVRGALWKRGFSKRVFNYLRRLNTPNLKKEYSRFVKKPDLNSNYIYVPLSFQPERTTSPQGDMYVDQILVVETLSVALPRGWKIYIKEHPSQWWLRTGVKYNAARYPGYYEALSKIPGVELVPIETNSFRLTEKAKAVAVVTGTAGFEALLRNVPTLIFGYPWFRDYPEAFRIYGPEDAKIAMEKVKNGFRPQTGTMLSFLKSLDEACIRGYIEGFVDKISKLSKEESQANVVSALREELRLLDN